MKKLKLKSVIFDMDGVITHTMPYHLKAWQQIFAEEKMAVPKMEIYRREGQKGIDSVIELALSQGHHITPTTAQKLLDQKEKLFKRIVQIRYITGSRLFIKRLKAAKFKLALVTGTSSHELRKILPVELLAYFDVVVSGCDVQNGKPHPEPYLKALQLLKVKDHEAIVIENAPFGIQSAKQAGLKCFALETSLPYNYLKQADRVFRSIRDLTSQIQFIPYASFSN